MMDVKGIVTEWLKEHGYDGLYVPGVCGCPIDDLMCCEEPCSQCEPGYTMMCEEGEGIGPVRGAVQKAE